MEAVGEAGRSKVQEERPPTSGLTEQAPQQVPVCAARSAPT